MKIANKYAVITGSSRGFGLSVAKSFVEAGAHIVICARGEKTLHRALNELTRWASKKSKVIAMPTDVSKSEDVDQLVQYALSEFGQIDVLMCNAGIYGPMGPIEQLDWAEWDRAVRINLYGTVLPCKTVIPYMKKIGRGKIIITSGGGATKPLPFLSAYAASKAAVVRFAETLSEEVKDYGIDVNAVAPGALNTRMLDEVLKAGPERVGEAFYKQMLKIKAQGGTPLEVGAALCLFLASEESNGITGKLISAVWDPWQKFPNRLNDLKGTDIFTLRRIIPAERGINWA